jgi:crotonobetainyl-CoA:carnitine CoA-transferase CaiB-like acyl-CoA transferase
MAGPLEGIRVVDMGFWVAGPAAAGIMADWGASVVKIEPPDGDPFRGVFVNAAGMDVPANPPFELDNRGKRSVGLNLQHPEGQAIAHRLIADADVFVSNLRRPALRKYRMTYEDLQPLNPRLVYCHVSGYGVAGADSDRPAYDVAAFWSRAGIAASLVPPGQDPPQQRGGMGDHMTAMAAVGAICAALLARQRTGTGQFVSTSLLRTGMYVLGWDLNIRLRLGMLPPPTDRFNVLNPVINSYRAGDGQWFWLVGLQADRHWPDVVRAIERPDLLDDPRFRDINARRDNAPVLVPILDRIFATKPLADWATIFDRENVWWAPVQTPEQVVNDPQARAAGGLVRVPTADGDAEMVANPSDFSATPWTPAAPAPEFGQHTEEVLLELGYDWETIARLKDEGAIP